MRGKITVLVLTALMILGLSVSNALAVNAVNYLGKTTWTAEVTDDNILDKIGQSFTNTGGISKVGDEFYLFQGYITVGTDGPFIMSGSGIMVGTELVFTLSESQQHTSITWRDSGVMHVTINTSTQNGTFYDIGHDFDPDTRQFDNRFTAGNLTLKGPAINLTPGASVGSTSLLLLEQ
jgi:hypothetical protein